MTPANPANAPLRRPTVPTREAAQAPVSRAAMQAAPIMAMAGFENDDEFRLDLRDIPRLRESMDVDGLKPSLLSRLFDLVAPLKP